MGRIKDTKLRTSSESVSVQDYNDYGPAYLFHAEQLLFPIALSIVFGSTFTV